MQEPKQKRLNILWVSIQTKTKLIMRTIEQTKINSGGYNESGLNNKFTFKT